MFIPIYFIEHKCLTLKKDRVLLTQGGYVSQTSNRQLTINKKANVLNKQPPRQTKTAAGSGNAISSSLDNNNDLDEGNDVCHITVSIVFCN